MLPKTANSARLERRNGTSHSVDSIAVRILLLWLGAALVSAGGYCWARGSAPDASHVIGAISTAIGVAIAAVVLFVVGGMFGRRAAWVLPVVVLGACLVRGLTAGAVAAEPPVLVASERGLARGLVRLIVVGASTPGSACRIEVVAPAGGTAFEVLAPMDSCPLAHGDEIRVPAEDMAWRTGVLSVDPPRIRVERVLLVRRASGASYWRALARARQWGWEASRGEPGRAFVIASSFGLVTALPPDLREDVRRAGLGHLIAVSGMHVGLLALAVQRLFRRALAPLGVGPRASIVASWVPVVAYVVATGGAAPAVRAAAMLAVVGVGSLLGRPAHGMTVLAMAATVMLVACPQWAIDPGFHLSVAAMAVLVRLPLDAGLVRSAWQLHWAVLPVALLHFGPAGAGAVAANLVALPIFTAWVMPLTAIGTLAIPLYGARALDPAAAGADLVLLVADHVAGWPVVPSWVLAIAAALALLARLLPRRPLRDAIVPPFLSALGVLVAVALDRPPPATAPSAQWYAFGSTRQPTVIAMGGERIACVQDPGGNAKRWPELLDALGIDRVGPIAWTGRVPESGGDPPHVAELAQELGRADRLEPGDTACEFPPPDVVRRGVTACARLDDGTHGAVAVAGDEAFCWQRGTWRTLAIEWEQ